jgi:hypothetical protein
VASCSLPCRPVSIVPLRNRTALTHLKNGDSTAVEIECAKRLRTGVALKGRDNDGALMETLGYAHARFLYELTL